MSKKILSKRMYEATLLSLDAYSQDETTDDNNTLPDGECPLQIVSVTMSVESSERPWRADAPSKRKRYNIRWRHR